MNAAVGLSGATAGAQQFVVPTYTCTSALSLRGTFQLSAATFYTLTSFFSNATLTGASGMWIVPVGTTTSTCYFGTATTMAAVQLNAIPAMLSAGLATSSATGLCLSAANTVELLIF